MAKWEYLVVFIEKVDKFPEDPIANTYAAVDKLSETLNRYGHAGWELVSLGETELGAKATFKRTQES